MPPPVPEQSTPQLASAQPPTVLAPTMYQRVYEYVLWGIGAYLLVQTVLLILVSGIFFELPTSLENNGFSIAFSSASILQAIFFILIFVGSFTSKLKNRTSVRILRWILGIDAVVLLIPIGLQLLCEIPNYMGCDVISIVFAPVFLICIPILIIGVIYFLALEKRLILWLLFFLALIVPYGIQGYGALQLNQALNTYAKNNPLPVISTTPCCTIDQNAISAASPMLSGTSASTTNTVEVLITPPSSNNVIYGPGYAPVVDGRWSLAIPFGTLQAGQQYTVLVGDSGIGSNNNGAQTSALITVTQ